MHLYIVTQGWAPDQGPAPWRMKRFTDAWVETGGRVTIIAPQADRSQEVCRKPDCAIETENESRTRIIRVKRGDPGSSILSRALDQGFVALNTVAAGLKHGSGEQRPSIILSTVPAVPSALSGRALSAFYGVPHAIDLRDAWPDLIKSFESWEPETVRKSLRRMISFQVLKYLTRLGGIALERTLRKSSLIVTTSNYLAETLKDRQFPNVVTVRNTPVDKPTNPTHPTAPEGRSKPERNLRLLYAGTVGRAQGLKNVIYALEICVQAGFYIDFRVVGDGAELGMLKGEAKYRGISIEFFEPVPYRQMDEHYEWCDASLVHLRDWPPLRKTIPSKLIETMSRGVPVLVAANGEASDIVMQTDAGVAVPAMKNRDLANALMRWAEFGVSTPNSAKTKSWLDTYADPKTTSQVLVESLLSLIS